MTDALFADASAEFSLCMKYRYRLSRVLPTGTGTLLWVMLNPSTADQFKLDPTVRKCVHFTRAWGYQRIEVVNLFAWRATDPRELAIAANPIGRTNDTCILEAASIADRIVFAWGNHGSFMGRGAAVARMLATFGPMCIKRNQDGSPVHPLYQPSNSQPVPFD